MSASNNQAKVATIRVKNAEGCSENVCSCLLLTLNWLSFLYVSLYWWSNLWILFVIFGEKKKRLAGIFYFNFSSKQSSAGSISRQQNKGGWCLNQAVSQSQLGWTFTPHKTNSVTEVEPFGPARGSLFCNSIFNTSVTSRPVWWRLLGWFADCDKRCRWALHHFKQDLEPGRSAPPFSAVSS